MPEPRTITLTLRATVLAAIVVVLMLGLLASQLYVIAEQRGIAARQEERSAPVLDAGRALLGYEDTALSAARRAGRALDSLQAVLTTVIEEDVVGITAEQLQRVPELVSAVVRTREILDRTYPTLRESLAIQRRTLDLAERSLAVQEEAVALQRALLARSDTIVAVANETLVHVRSLDAKTGGTAPPVLP